LRTSDKIASALFGRTKQRILALLFSDVQRERPLYLREIARQAGSGIGAVQRELSRLTSAGLIVRSSEGARVFYSANRLSPIYGELRSIVAKTAGIAEVVREALQRFHRTRLIKVAFIYGSVAVGKQTSSSDLDLVVVGRITLTQLWPRLRRLQMSTGREINAIVYSSEEFARKYARREHFLRRVMERPKLMLVGTEDDLEELVRKPLARRA
jgi:predicted nucleotidyltransferase